MRGSFATIKGVQIAIRFNALPASWTRCVQRFGVESQLARVTAAKSRFPRRRHTLAVSGGQVQHEHAETLAQLEQAVGRAS